MKTKLHLVLFALLLLFAQTTANAQDYQVRAWGLNTSGQLGDGTITNRSVSVQISGFASVTQISGGNTHTLALKSDGTVWAWGNNTYGALGNGTTTSTNTPIQVMSLSGATWVAAGRYHSLAVAPPATQLDINSVSGNYGQPLTLTARLKDRQSLDGISGKVINFTIDQYLRQKLGLSVKN